MKRTALLGLIICIGLAFADSLPWKGHFVFRPWVRVDDAPGPSGHPANHPLAVMDTNRTFYAVWQDDRGNTGRYHIYFSKSVDLCSTWTTNQNLTSLLGNMNHIYPWIAVDTRSNLYVVWQAQQGNQPWRVMLTRSTDLGATWTAPDTIKGVVVRNSTTSNINSGPQPKIAVDSRSHSDTTFLYLTWVDDSTNVLRIAFARSVNLGDLFGLKKILDHNPTNINREPYPVADDSGNVHCIWRRGTGGSNQDPKPWLAYNKSTDHGVSFRPADVIVNDTIIPQSYRGNPTLTVNASNGNILSAWEDSRRTNDPNPDIFWSRSTDGGLTFSSNRRVNYFTDTSASFDNRKPAIWIDPQGIAVVAWHDNNNPGGRFGIHMAAYSDSLGIFSTASSLLNTYTENSSGAFGTNLYPPSLYVTVIDSVTNLFLVWQDYTHDAYPNGNIYSVRGWLVDVLGDIDVYGDSLDVKKDTIYLGRRPAGPPYARGRFVFANTDSAHNPDTLDGPSLEDLDSVRAPMFTLRGPNNAIIDSGMVFGVPESLKIGTVVTCSVGVFIPQGSPPGTYVGMVTIKGHGKISLGECYDTFFVKIDGPYARPNLDSLRVFPIPFKPLRNPRHHAIYFYGLTNDTWVRVYDIAGAKVWEHHETDGDGLASWDAKIDGKEVANGIYIYYIATSSGEKKKGKLSIIR